MNLIDKVHRVWDRHVNRRIGLTETGDPADGSPPQPDQLRRPAGAGAGSGSVDAGRHRGQEAGLGGGSVWEPSRRRMVGGGGGKIEDHRVYYLTDEEEDEEDEEKGRIPSSAKELSGCRFRNIDLTASCLINPRVPGRKTGSMSTTGQPSHRDTDSLTTSSGVDSPSGCRISSRSTGTPSSSTNDHYSARTQCESVTLPRHFRELPFLQRQQVSASASPTCGGRMSNASGNSPSSTLQRLLGGGGGHFRTNTLTPTDDRTRLVLPEDFDASLPSSPVSSCPTTPQPESMTLSRYRPETRTQPQWLNHTRANSTGGNGLILPLNQFSTPPASRAHGSTTASTGGRVMKLQTAGSKLQGAKLDSLSESTTGGTGSGIQLDNSSSPVRRRCQSDAWVTKDKFDRSRSVAEKSYGLAQGPGSPVLDCRTAGATSTKHSYSNSNSSKSGSPPWFVDARTSDNSVYCSLARSCTTRSPPKSSRRLQRQDGSDRNGTVTVGGNSSVSGIVSGSVSGSASGGTNKEQCQRVKASLWFVSDDVILDDNLALRQEHACKVLGRAKEFMTQQQLCDVVLVADERRIPAHRVVICSASDYFAAMFTSDVREAVQAEVRLEGVDYESLQLAVHYMYSGRADLREEAVEGLLSVAGLLQLPDLVDQCASFMAEHLNVSNCIGIRAFAETQSCCSLSAAANNYIAENFSDVIDSHEFVLLSVDDVVSLLSCDELNVSSEETIFLALMTWAQYDAPSRRKHLSTLLGHVKLPLLSPQFIADQVESNSLLKDDRSCQDLIIEAMKYHLLPERRLSMQSPRTRPRKSTVGLLYAVGGVDSAKGSPSIEVYNPRTDGWTQVAHVTGRRLQFGVAAVDGRLYVVGGRDGLKTLNTVEAYEPRTKRWTSMPSMGTHRHGLGVGVLEGPVYAVGGHDGWSYLNTAERLDPQTRQWTYIAPMMTARSTVGVAVVLNKLYAVGGRDGSSCLKTVECYDPHTNKWFSCCPMNKCRGGVGVGVCNGLIYAVGGHDAPSNNPAGSSRYDSVERYDTKLDCWTMVSSISSPRDAVGVCPLGDKLFAVGGCDGQHYLSRVESYDPITNEWTQVAPLSVGRAGACVVHMKMDLRIIDLS